MAFLVQESTDLSRFQPHFASLQHHRRPMLLKDFLRDDASHSRSNKPHIVLLRSWSKRAAATKISAVHKVIKLLQFASVKSPSLLLPRSISRKLSKRGKGDDDFVGEVSEVKVKVKDILRWKSFRDLAEDDPNFPSSPDRATAAAATTTTTSSCSKRSSWCDSDFTADEEELPPWNGENEDFSWGRNAATLKNPKGDWSLEEYDQQSPVSVLDSPFRHDEFDGEILKSWTEGELEESYEWEVEEKREAFLKEMEKGICWNKFGEEQQEMCKELEIRVLNDLLDDLVAHFLQ